jgi:transcriptional regulator with XRE-family HTH domain
MEQDEITVGNCLRELRTARDLSMRALARACGLSANTIGLIEQGKTSPSVSTLQVLATALHVPITAFFEDRAPAKSVVFTPANDRAQVALPDGVLERLGTGLPEQCFQPFVLRLEPGGNSGPDPIVHTGHEFVLCMDGCLVYEVEGVQYTLDKGDSLLFEAHLPHRWHNAGEGIMEAMLVLYSPEGTDRPFDLHLG